MPELHELAKSIDAWTADIPHNKYKQRLFEPLHTMPAWEEQLKNAEKIGSKAEKQAKEPMDLRNIFSAVYNREKAIAHLDYLNTVLEQARSAPPLLLPGKSAEAVRAANVEALQIEWMRDVKLRDRVLALKTTLESAVKAYNNQITTVCLRGIHRRLLHLSTSTKEVHAIFGHSAWKKMTGEEAQEALHRLEDRFYSQGNGHLQAAGEHYTALDRHHWGRLFLLTLEDEKKLVANRRAGRY